MNFGFLFSGIMVGLTIFVISFYIFYLREYFEVENWESIQGVTIITFSIIVGMFDFISFLTILIENVNKYFLIGSIVGIVISMVYIFYMFFSINGVYVRINKKIDKIDENILKLNNWNITDKQSQAIEILKNTRKKLKEQANDILIMDSIKIAKNIELSNKKFNIQTELDELEALQLLNR